MSFIDTVMSIFPRVEVCVRCLYKRGSKNKILKKLKNKYLKNKEKSPIIIGDLYERMFEHIKAYGIKNGDILIVHSSMDGMERLGVSAEKIIEGLFELVGENGTLVMPAFPKFKKKDILDNGKIKIYDVRKTLAWTGFINNVFIRTKGVIRSEFPYNPLAAKGKDAPAMFKDNLKGEVPHGKYSAWEYCAQHHAKVLFLGVKPYHSITEAHLSEDSLNEEWPIDNWYVKQKYYVRGYNSEFYITVKERNPYWARYVAEHNAIYRMKKAGYIMEENLEGINIGFIKDLYTYNEYRIEQARKGKIDFLIPKKYWKKHEQKS